MTMYIAEDIPAYRLTGQSPPGGMSDEDHAISEVTISTGENEQRVREAMAIHLIKTAYLPTVVDRGRTRAHLAASTAIANGVDMVGIGNRVYRVRTAR